MLSSSARKAIKAYSLSLYLILAWTGTVVTLPGTAPVSGAAVSIVAAATKAAIVTFFFNVDSPHYKFASLVL